VDDLQYGYQASSVPEPATFTLFCIGAVGVFAFSWRQRKFRA
jgi:hypothetical protein